MLAKLKSIVFLAVLSEQNISKFIYHDTSYTIYHGDVFKYNYMIFFTVSFLLVTLFLIFHNVSLVSLRTISVTLLDYSEVTLHFLTVLSSTKTTRVCSITWWKVLWKQSGTMWEHQLWFQSLRLVEMLCLCSLPRRLTMCVELVSNQLESVTSRGCWDAHKHIHL